MSLRRTPSAKGGPRIDHVVQVGYLLNRGANVATKDQDVDTRPAHLRNRFKSMKQAAADKRMPKMPDVFQETPIASGTYGFIFRSKCDSNRVFKASVNHELGASCPASFKHEHDVSNFITKLLSSEYADMIDYNFYGTNPSHFASTDTFCFFAMDYIVPVANQSTLIELMPGEQTLDRLEDGFRNARPAMTNTGGWLQYGKRATKELLNARFAGDMDFDEYCTGMGRLCASCNFMGILLADVEFIVGSNGKQKGVFVLDFDKVMALDQEVVFTEKYRSNLAALSFDQFGTPEGVGFDSYALIQFPYTEPYFNDAYTDHMKRLLGLSKPAVERWMQATGRNTIREVVPRK